MKFKKSDLVSAIVRGADWLVDSAQDNDRRSPTFGAMRNGYWVGLNRWDWFEPVWHTGQAALALLIAHRLQQEDPHRGRVEPADSPSPFSSPAAGRGKFRRRPTGSATHIPSPLARREGRVRGVVRYGRADSCRYLRAAIRGGEYILRKQIVDPRDPVRHGHIRGYVKPDETTSNNSTFLESLVGLLELHKVTGEERWLRATLDALDWTIRNAWLEKEGLVLDNFDWNAGEHLRPNADCKRVFTPSQLRKLGVRASARPLIDDSMFYRAYKLTGEEKYLRVFRRLADRLLADQDQWGNWIGYIPCDVFTGRFHARQAWWWGYPLLDAYREFGHKKYLHAAMRAADWYVWAQHRDGSMAYSTFTDGRANTMLAVCGSATACSALLYHELLHEFRRKKYAEPLDRAITFLLTTQHSEQFPDENARGAFFEAWGAKPGLGAHVYQIRDIATTFAIRALARLI